jgi:hypothetical protein
MNWPLKGDVRAPRDVGGFSSQTEPKSRGSEFCSETGTTK